MIITIANPKSRLKLVCASLLLFFAFLLLNGYLEQSIFKSSTVLTADENANSKDPFQEQKSTTLKACFDIGWWSMSQWVSIYIPETSSVSKSAWVKVELPPEYTMEVDNAWSAGLKLTHLSQSVWLIERSNNGPGIALKNRPGNLYLRFVCTGHAPNKGHNFLLREIKLPKIIGSNFDIKPFQCEYLATHNGGVSWGLMADY
jgi:hypothetical protein